MKSYLLAAAFAVLNVAAHAQIYYDIDFSSPTHTVGVPVSVGSGPNEVSGITSGTPTVVSSYDHLLNQPLRMDMTGNDPTFYYDQFVLTLPAPFTPSLRVDFDFDSIGLLGSPAQFAMFFDTPTIRRLDFRYDGTIGLFGRSMSGYYYKTIGRFSDRTAYHLTVAVDQTHGIWDVYQNGVLLSEDIWTADYGIQEIRFSYGLYEGTSIPDRSSIGIDNIVVTGKKLPNAVPEPSTYGAMGAVLLLCAAAFRRTQIRSVAYTRPSE